MINSDKGLFVLVHINSNIEYHLFSTLIWVLVFFWIGRDTGYVIDKQYRDLGGKPIFVTIPYKWKWLFRFQNTTYAYKNKIVRASVFTYLLGYFFAILEIAMLFLAIVPKMRKIAFVINDWLVVLFIILWVIMVIPDTIRYERNMQITYDYNWITYLQEAFSLNPKQCCRVVSQIDEATYEITIGRFSKRRYLAITEVHVNVGEKKYAIHVYNERGPYWIIRNR